MSPAQYGQFKRLAGKQKLLYSVIRDADGKGKLFDVVMPVTEIERANLIFERMLYQPQPEHAEVSKEQSPKKEFRLEHGSHDTRGRSDSVRDMTRTTNERLSVRARLEGYREQLQTKQPDAPTEHGSHDTRGRSDSVRDMTRTTNERLSVRARLEGYREQLQTKQPDAPTKVKHKSKSR